MRIPVEQSSFRVFELLEERKPVHEYEFLGGENWKQTSYFSSKDWKSETPHQTTFMKTSQVMSDLDYFEVNWHHYTIKPF